MKTDIHHLYGEDDYVTIHLTHHVSFAPQARFNTRTRWLDVCGHAVDAKASPSALRFEGERIAEEWVVRDELQVPLQVGAVRPLP